MELDLRLGNEQDLPRLIDHLKRSVRESGTGQNPIFSPVLEWNRDEASFIEQRIGGMNKSVTECGWIREIILETKDQLIIGNVTLFHSPPHASCLHRATLGMGIESKFQGRGQGKKLLNFAIEFAKAQQSLEWIDLYVFEHNVRALALYKSCGFIMNGRREDFFRIKGEFVTDLSMSLKL